MTDQPTPTARDMVELPGPFTFKVFVKPEVTNGQQLKALSARVLGRELPDQALRKNTSRTGKYEAYTLEAQIEVFEEIEAMYTALKAEPGVVMTL